MQITMTVNGTDVTNEVEPRVLLVHYIRDVLRLTGTHWGCDTSNCGTCVVLMDGQPVKSCTVLAAMADGHAITTVEGLATGGTLDPVQQGFMEEHGLQCGFCTPGMMLTARALLDVNPHPDDTEIRRAISGQICRCTGYATIVRSVHWAADHPAGLTEADADGGDPAALDDSAGTTTEPGAAAAEAARAIPASQTEPEEVTA
ncbi:(2Fe-2S)-binding protein [Cryobacterium sp. GrIS_2_6]|uniref:(2Fe-2S)-binding protein n=1 Tax=Cryobacterium sp. GrIS_2_6 TaxID=3162785 RepID=UPI002DF971A9|nr:carbon-monoxide dehydrogenase small subunit [Cryobacterium psychrotolerans]